MRVSNVKISINKDVIAKLNKASEKALSLTAQATLADIVSRTVVPLDNGYLEDSGFVDDSETSNLVASIIFDTPYARRWYFNLEGATFQKKNENAQDHWMDYYLDGEGKQWVIDTYAKFLKQESGGIIK